MKRNKTDDIIGKVFGRLTVTQKIDDYISPSGGKHKRYACICRCGKECSVLKEHLTSGRQKSCGCLKKENGIRTHGDIHSRLYRIWGNMRNRCSNMNNPAWDNYGGRGITVCREWDSYETFREWAISSGYSDTLTIDRIDYNGNYSPENCRWVDYVTQSNNKRDNHVVEYEGKTMTLSQWSKHLDIPYKALHARINRYHWDIDRAFNQPVRK